MARDLQPGELVRYIEPVVHVGGRGSWVGLVLFHHPVRGMAHILRLHDQVVRAMHDYTLGRVTRMESLTDEEISALAAYRLVYGDSFEMRTGDTIDFGGAAFLIK